MKYAFTITTNSKKINTNKELFITDFLRYIQVVCGYDVQQLEFTIEHALTMGYHAHGIIDTYLKPLILDKSFYIYQKVLNDNNDITNWRLYMHKDVYTPCILLDE